MEGIVNIMHMYQNHMEQVIDLEDIFKRLELVKAINIPNNMDRFVETISENRCIQYIDKYSSKLTTGYFLHVSVRINIPSKGVYQSLDIKDSEDLLIYFHEKYPYYAPSVIICRNDFPYEYTPHLNYGINKSNIKELNLCLFRGNIDEWYVNNNEGDFLNLVVCWFQDLVNGNLIKNDGFEAIRYMGGIFGNVIANYDSLIDYIKEGKLNKGYKIFDGTINKSVLKMIHVTEKEFTFDTPNKIPCILLGDNVTIDNTYISRSICKLSDLSHFISYKYLTSALNKARNEYYVKKDYKFDNGIVILMSLKRPQQVIGQFSDYEIIGFWLSLDWASMDRDNAEIELLGPIKKLSSCAASKLSGVESKDKKMLIIGCGSVGSKISLNFAKMGIIDQLLIDDDLFCPHNIIRHENVPFLYQGCNKAQYVASTINLMYGVDEKAQYLTSSGFEIDFASYNQYNIIDCTASQSFMSYIVENKDVEFPIMRSELADSGRMGFSFIEGQNRNPNVNEMKILTWYLALKNKNIENWLINAEMNEVDPEIQIGYGCSSDTMIMDNATISYHTSVIPHFYMNHCEQEVGKILISHINKEKLQNNKIDIIEVDKFTRLVDKNIKVSISNTAINKAKETLDEDKENAGIWIGRYCENSNEIVIIDTFISNEHIRNKDEIICGDTDVREYIEKVNKSTNGLIGYIGEWHTHPKGDASPSEKDLNTFSEVRSKISENNTPMLMSIFGSETDYHKLLN